MKEQRINFANRSTLGLIALAGVTAMSLSFPARAELSGNIGVYSKYVLRGLTNDAESDDVAVQGGLDYAHESGFYAGWWASTLDYTYSKDGGATSGNGFENDFYAGYAGEYNNFTYDVGLIQYLYMDVDDSDLTELALSVGYGPASLGMNYLLTDGWWGNQGDIYWNLGFEWGLPRDFTFGATLGYYIYSDDDSDKLCYPDPAGCGVTTKESAFRHLDLTLSHPIGNTGADMSVSYIVGGKSRDNTEQEDTMVLSVSYAFDI